MNFNSLQYYLFLPIVIVLYYILPVKLRTPLLLLASYFFYMCWRPEYALLILTSTIITYFCGRCISRYPERKKFWLAASLVLNLAILFFFKYFNFAAGLISDILGSANLNITAPSLDILLPVGISFYTFQALGYTIDVYRGDIEAEKSFPIYALFVSFFPQLVAGPIERSRNLLPQFREVHRFSWDKICQGMLPFLWGLFKKIVIADQLAVIVNTVYAAPENFAPYQLVVATIAFAFQIYCDFSAYSDIARGSATMLGFRLMRNFDSPYFATSVKDFWRRWHISLSTWFRDYLYFPLGGSRCSQTRHYLNLLIVFAVSGLWHGAALTFIVWGLLNGIYQVVSLITAPVRKKIQVALHLKDSNLLLTIFRYAVTFALICIAWVFFRADSLGDATYILSAIFGLVPSAADLGQAHLSMGLDMANTIMVIGAMLVLLIVDYLGLKHQLASQINKTIIPRYVIYFLLIAVILIFGSYGVGYDPQDFVYFQF